MAFLEFSIFAFVQLSFTEKNDLDFLFAFITCRDTTLLENKNIFQKFNSFYILKIFFYTNLKLIKIVFAFCLKIVNHILCGTVTLTSIFETVIEFDKIQQAIEFIKCTRKNFLILYFFIRFKLHERRGIKAVSILLNIFYFPFCLQLFS